MNGFLDLILLSSLLKFSFGCVSSDFNLGKNTWASANSARDYEWATKLVPGIEDQGATKFNQGDCGIQSKLVLDGSCFKIHHPTTFQHDQYKLRVAEIETVFTKKVESLTSSTSDTETESTTTTTKHHYDAFLDHNMGFYVPSIDSLIEAYDEYGVDYWLLKWQNKMLGSGPKGMINNGDTWLYSLLVHSPGSQILYEFMTIRKPVDYDNLEFMESEMRATFEGFKPNYPWQPESKFSDYDIVPVRLSRSVSNVDENVLWYESVLQSRRIYKSNDYEIASMNGDNVNTKMGFMLNKGVTVEIAFVERESDYTEKIELTDDDIESFLTSDEDSLTIIESLVDYIEIEQSKSEGDDEVDGINSEVVDVDVGDVDIGVDLDRADVYNGKYSFYKVSDWEDDLALEYESIVLNEVCGFARWFDNHYGMQTWAYDGLLDKILTALRRFGYKYRVFKQNYQHTNDDGKELMEKYDKDMVYSLWAVEPNGQTMHIAGDLINLEDEFSGNIPTWDPQWCRQECGTTAAILDEEDDALEVVVAEETEEVEPEGGETDVVEDEEASDVVNLDKEEGEEEVVDENQSNLAVNVHFPNPMHLKEKDILSKKTIWYWIGLGIAICIIGSIIFVIIYIKNEFDTQEISSFVKTYLLLRELDPMGTTTTSEYTPLINSHSV